MLNWQGFVGLLPVGFRAAADRCYANGDQLPASIGKRRKEEEVDQSFSCAEVQYCICPVGQCINDVVTVRGVEVRNPNKYDGGIQ